MHRNKTLRTKFPVEAFMQQINSIYQNLDTDSSWAELHDSFQAEYEKFLQDTSDEIAQRTQRLNELKSYKNSISSSKNVIRVPFFGS
jgi:hypothetical protein